MSTATAIVQQIYEAFGRGDVPAILGMVAGEVDWEFVASPGVAYSGKRRNHAEVAAFFADVGKSDQIHAFEPREFIDAGSDVTVLGWEKSTAIDTSEDFETEWVHLFTIKNGKVTRWRGFFNTAARFGL